MNPAVPAPKASLSLVAIVVLMAGLFLSTVAAIFAFRSFDSDESQRFNEAVDEIHSDLQSRLNFFTHSIRQLAAVYAINPNLSEETFINYTYSTGMRGIDEDIYSYGIFKRSKGTTLEKDRYLIELREIGTHVPRKVVPLGTDISKDVPRVALFREAIDTARVVLATHVPGLLPGTEAGQMMVAAAYVGNRNPATVAERRKMAIGIAFARFSETGLFDQVLQNAGTYKAHLDVQVFDGPSEASANGKAKPLYERHTSAVDLKSKVLRSSVFKINAGGRPFTVRILSPNSQISSPASLIAILILAIGVAASLLAFRLIRERERRSDRLFKSERQLKLITESLPVLIAYIDSDLTYRFNNRIYEDVIGLPRNQITNHKIEEILGPVFYREQLEPNLLRALSGETIEHDLTLTRANGSIRRYHQVLLPDLDDRGVVKGVVSMHTDVTERAKSEERTIFLEEVSTILATSLDPSIVAEKLTKKLVSLCDWCVIELLNDDAKIERHLYAASTPKRFDRLANFYKDFPPSSKDRRLTGEARETKTTQVLEHVTLEGLKPYISNPFRLEALQRIGFESIVIVPLVNGERVLGTLALYSGEKEKRFTGDDVTFFEDIALRSSLAFENTRLYAESQNLNRAKDHFLAMLSHELRTPMNVILGWLEILTTEDVDDETYAQALDTLNRNAKVQIQLINDLLDVSRIINGKLSLHAAHVNIGSVASGALDNIQPSVRAKNIECSLKIDGDVFATVDSERIQQVLWNLLSNAVKFTPNGGKIEIKVNGDQNDVRMSVTDSGQGIDANFLPFVFDRFRQEEGGFTRSQGGLGLGLSIVRYIVEGHGGTIAVTSTGRNQGTTFTVVLPKVSQILDESHFTEPAL